VRQLAAGCTRGRKCGQIVSIIGMTSCRLLVGVTEYVHLFAPPVMSTVTITAERHDAIPGQSFSIYVEQPTNMPITDTPIRKVLNKAAIWSSPIESYSIDYQPKNRRVRVVHPIPYPARLKVGFIILVLYISLSHSAVGKRFQDHRN